jgi:hypothetical protein
VKKQLVRLYKSLGLGIGVAFFSTGGTYVLGSGYEESDYGTSLIGFAVIALVVAFFNFRSQKD